MHLLNVIECELTSGMCVVLDSGLVFEFYLSAFTKFDDGQLNLWHEPNVLTISLPSRQTQTKFTAIEKSITTWQRIWRRIIKSLRWLSLPQYNLRSCRAIT